MVAAILLIQQHLTQLQNDFDALVIDFEQYEARIIALETDVENLNDAVDSLNTLITDLTTDVEAIASTVDNNIIDIDNNTSAITDHTTTIGNNVINISNNASAISDHATAIGNNVDNINNNASAISDHTTTIGNNVDNINNNASAISDHTTTIGNNISNISINNGLILTNDGLITTNISRISTNNGLILTNISNISINGGLISNNTTALSLLNADRQFTEVGPLTPTSYDYFYTIANPYLDNSAVGLYFKTKYINSGQIDYFFAIWESDFYLVGRPGNDPTIFHSIITTQWNTQNLQISFSITCEADVSSNLYTLNTVGAAVDVIDSSLDTLETSVETLETKVTTLETKVTTLEDEIEFDTSNVFTVENIDHEVYRVGHLVESLGVTSNLNGDSGVVVDSTRCFTNVRLLRSARAFLGVITAFDNDYITYRTCGCCLVLVTRIVTPVNGNTLIPYVDDDIHFTQMADVAHMMPALMDNYIVGKIINSTPVIDASLAVYEDVDYQFVSVFLK